MCEQPPITISIDKSVHARLIYVDYMYKYAEYIWSEINRK